LSNKEPKVGQRVCVKDSLNYRIIHGKIDGYVPGLGFSIEGAGGVFLYRHQGTEWEFVKVSLENK